MSTRILRISVQQQNRHGCSYQSPLEKMRGSKRGPKRICDISYKGKYKSIVADAIFSEEQSEAKESTKSVDSKNENRIVDVRYKPFLDAWDKTFIDSPEDPEGYYVDRVIGKIPEELEGTFFRNGPNKFERDEEGYAIQHPYDGDGFVCSLSIKDGKAFFRSRFIETFEFKAEEKEGRVLFRGTFATQRKGGASKNAGDVYVKNTSNTNICYFKGNLWALFEAGQPYRIDPFTLETIGIDTFQSTISLGLPFELGSDENNAAMASFVRLCQRLGDPYFGETGLPEGLTLPGGDAVSAHPKMVNDRMITFSYKIKPGFLDNNVNFDELPLYTELTFHEFSASESGTVKLVDQKLYNIPGFAFLHDFAVTESYYIIFQNPVTVDNAPYVLGKSPAASCVRWVKGKPSIVHIIPRPGSNIKTTRTFEIPPSFVFHHANAYEEQEDIIIDSIHYKSLPAIGREALPEQGIDPNVAFNSKLKRTTVNLKTGIVGIRTISNEYLEMPSVNPLCQATKHRYVYGYQSDFDNRMIGISQIPVDSAGIVNSWFPGPGKFLLEPRFIPRSEEDSSDHTDGWVIAQYFDSETAESAFFLFDALNIQNGPIARIMLKNTLPSALHGAWTNDYFGPV